MADVEAKLRHNNARITPIILRLPPFYDGGTIVEYETHHSHGNCICSIGRFRRSGTWRSGSAYALVGDCRMGGCGGGSGIWAVLNSVISSVANMGATRTHHP